MKIGVVVESFQAGFFGGVKRAAALGIRGVQAYGTMGELAVEAMTPQKIAEARRFLADEGMTLTALCGDIGAAMFYDPAANAPLLAREKRVMELARELGTTVVTTHIGVVPQDETCPRYRNMLAACRELAAFADSMGGHFAVETGPEKSETLRAFLDKLDSRGVAVNLDPANLVMCAGDDPVAAVANLAPYIVHTHAKDGIMLQKTDTRNIYDAGHDGTQPVVFDEYFRELPLGEGAVPFDAYLQKLGAVGFDGWLTIEREVGADPAADIRLAADFLRERLSRAAA